MRVPKCPNCHDEALGGDERCWQCGARRTVYVSPADSGEAARPAQGTTTGKQRDIKLLRDTLQKLCDFVWNGRVAPGVHMWSIPADMERDFDCILSDAIDELETLRGQSAPVLPPALTREAVEQAVREAFGKELLPSIVAVLVNELSKALAPVVAAPDGQTPTWRDIDEYVPPQPYTHDVVLVAEGASVVAAYQTERGYWLPDGDYDDGSPGSGQYVHPTHFQRMPLPPLPSGAGVEK